MELVFKHQHTLTVHAALVLQAQTVKHVIVCFKNWIQIKSSTSSTEYFVCPSDGRFVDPYSCATGGYFECVHYGNSKCFTSIQKLIKV